MTTSRVSLLLVEDEPKLSRIVLDAVEAAGADSFEVHQVSTLDAALEAVRAAPPDVLLLDLTLSDVENGQVVERARAGSPHSAVIVLAEHADEASAMRALQQGAQDYLVKDHLSAGAFSRSIRNALERQRLMRELRQRMDDLEAEDRRFRTIVHTTTDGIVIVDADTVIQFVNRATEMLFGRTERELLGQPFGLTVFAGESTELDILRANGTQAIAELRVADIDWEGRSACLISLRDVTERRLAEDRERKLIREQAARAEAEAAERRARFLAEAGNTLADSLDYLMTLRTLARLTVPFLADWCMVDVIDQHGGVSRVAVAHADPDKAALASQLSSLPADPAALTGVAHVLRTGKPELIPQVTDPDLQKITTRPDQLALLRELAPQSALMVPLVARGRPLGAFILVSSESRRIYTKPDLDFVEELARRASIAVDNARLYQEAQQANQAKADFLAIMSHELRTPLNAVIGYSDLMIIGVPTQIPAELRSPVERIRASARHLLRLIEEILTYARMEAGHEDLDIVDLDAVELVRDAVALIEPLALQKNLNLNLRLPVAPIRLRTDADKLRRILINLLSNAVKFTNSGDVGIAFAFDGPTAQFTVWDTGAGIPQDDLARIFDAFWQVEQSRTRTAEGTGLGLTVARRLARLLGGDIEVQSAVGRGSQFRVRITPFLSVPDSRV